MVISIDIGTSYSSVCMQNAKGEAEPVETSTGISMYGSKYSLPSAVFVEDNGEVLVGQAAMNSRKKKPQNFRSEFKRDLGQDVPIVLGDRSFLPEGLYTELFRHMKKCAEKSGNDTVEKAYITYPASFGKARCGRIRQAAKDAGLFDVELLDEPTAAAMCYGAKGTLKDGDVLLVYDFGGGTFDVSLLQYGKGRFEPLVTAMGMEHCGGIDMDRAIYADMMSKVDPETVKQLSANKANRMRFEGQLAELAVKVKHHLSNAEQADEVIPIGFDILDYGLSRERLEGMVAELVSQTVDCCKGILADAGIGVGGISGILLVGGTSRVPLVQEMIRKFAGATPVYQDVDPDLAVAMGALEWGYSQKQDTSLEASEQRQGQGESGGPKALGQEQCRKLDACKIESQGSGDEERRPFQEGESHTILRPFHDIRDQSVQEGKGWIEFPVALYGKNEIRVGQKYAFYTGTGEVSCILPVKKVWHNPFEEGYRVKFGIDDSEKETEDFYRTINWMISAPVTEHTYSEALFWHTSSSVIHTGGVEGRLLGKFHAVVEEIQDGKVKGRILSNGLPKEAECPNYGVAYREGLLELNIYREKGLFGRFQWVFLTCNMHYFTCATHSWRCLEVGDIISDALLPEGYTFTYGFHPKISWINNIYVVKAGARCKELNLGLTRDAQVNVPAKGSATVPSNARKEDASSKKLDMVSINNAKLEKIKQLCRDFAKGSSEFQGNEKLYVTLGIQGKEVYLAHDDSWFQRGKNGFAITNSGIYCCNFSSSKTHVPFWKLAKADDICIQEPELFADGNRIAYFSGSKSTRQDLKELFGKIAAAYR